MIINQEMDNVEVRYMQRGNKTRFFQVLVRSHVKPTLKKIGELEDTTRASEKKMAQRIGVLAGAMAEQLCEEYQDDLEPSNVAKAAMEAYREMMAEQQGLMQEWDQEA